MGIADRLKQRLDSMEPRPPAADAPIKRTGAETVMEGGFRARVEAAEAEASGLRTEIQRLATDSASKAALIERLRAESRLGEPLQLDPSAIEISRIYNRSAASLDPERSRALAALLPQIAATGGNVQPGLVRPKGQGAYELVFGERRLAACRHLGLSFRAIVAEVSDAELIRLRVAENLGRVDPSAWALSRQIAAAQALTTHEDRDAVLTEFGFSRQHLWRCGRIGSLPDDLEQVHPDIDAVSVRNLMAMVEYLDKQPAAFKRAIAACRTGTLSAAEATRVLTGTVSPSKTQNKSRLTLKRQGLTLELRCSPEQAEVIAARILGLTRELGLDVERAGAPEAL